MTESGDYTEKKLSDLDEKIKETKEKSEKSEELARAGVKKLKMDLAAVSKKAQNESKKLSAEILGKARLQNLYEKISLETFRTDGGAQWPQWALWAVVAAIIFSGHHLMGAAIAAALISVSIEVGARRETSAKRMFANEFSKLFPRGMAFEKGFSENMDFPYETLVLPGSQDLAERIGYRIDRAQYGEWGGARMISFCFDEKSSHGLFLYGFRKGDEEGVKGRYIPMVEAAEGERGIVWRTLCDRLSKDLCKIALLTGKVAIRFKEAETAGRLTDVLNKKKEAAAENEKEWNEVSLPENLRESMLRAVDAFASGLPCKGFLLHGMPGTGKSSIGRVLARVSGCKFMSVGVADLKAGHVGQTAPKVKEVWDKARSQAPCILFVDECDSALGRRGSGDVFGDELVNTFIQEWEGVESSNGQVFVIGATNRPDMLDDAVMRRFEEKIEIPLPNAESRRAILNKSFLKFRINITATDAMVRDSSGMSGSDIDQMAGRMARKFLGVDPTQENVIEEIKTQRSKNSTGVANLSWDDLVMPESVKTEFEHLGKELRAAETLRKHGLDVPRGALLWGPPGTGKTQLARVLANEAGLSFLAYSTSDLKQVHIGESGKAVKEMFAKARTQSPCLLFIDELDIIAPQRGMGGRNNQTDEEIIGQMLQEMDGVAQRQGSVFVMAASNHPENIDEAVKSRLERILEIPLPNETARKLIFEQMLRSKTTDFDKNEGARQAASLTDGKSGRDLRSIVESAGRKAVKRALVNSDDIDETLLTMTLNDLLSSCEDK